MLQRELDAAPSRAAQVSKTALTAVRLQDSGRTMAVGAGDGSTTVLRLSAGLADMQPNEKPAFLAVTLRPDEYIYIHGALATLLRMPALQSALGMPIQLA